MITVKELTYSDFQQAYFNLISDFYKHDLAYAYYINDLKKGLEYAQNSNEQTPYFFCAYINNKVAGCISIIEDDRLEKGECVLGFFECENNKEAFDGLWNKALKKAKALKADKIIGTVNGTIWHQYRIISKSYEEDLFPSEPVTKDYYYDFFKLKNPLKEIKYYSAYRNNYDTIIELTRPSFIKMQQENISIEKIEKFDIDFIQAIYSISKNLFQSNWGYVPLSFSEFIELYNTTKIDNFIGSVYAAKQNHKILGFCMNLETQESVIMKTIAVLPEYQQKGIANALVYKIHSDAKKKNKRNVVYALIRNENKIQYFPKDEILMLRTYSAFEYDV